METTVAKNGAVRDKKTGRIVAMPALDRDTARDMVRAREEKRIRLYNEGAKRAVLDPQLIRDFGDDAHIVERGMTLQTIASTPDAGKAAVMAAQHLDKAQGLVADKQDTSVPEVQGVAQALGTLLIEFARRKAIADSDTYTNVIEGDAE